MKNCFYPLVFALLTAPAAAHAGELLDGSKPARILEIFKGYGSASLEKDAGGDPKIVGRMQGTQYGVSFYGCEGGKNCSSIQIQAAWDGYTITLEQINDWNRKKRFGKAYLDSDNDPYLEMQLNLRDGVSRKNLDDTIDWWRIAVEEFKAQVLNKAAPEASQ